MVRKSKSRVKAPAARTDREVLLNRWGIKIDPKLLELPSPTAPGLTSREACPPMSA